MRIGLVTGEYPPMQGGVGAFSRVLGQTFARLGHDVVMITRQQGTQTDEGIMLHHEIGDWRASSLFALRKIAKQHRLDVINLQFQTSAFDMSPAIHFLPQVMGDIPVVTTFHDLRVPYLFPKAGPLRGWIVKHLARTSAGVIVTNHEDLAQVHELPRHMLIPIGSNILSHAEAPESRMWREKAGAGDGDFLIGYFGFINHSKGVDVLLHSIAEMRSKGVSVKLILVGGRTGASDPTNAIYALEIDHLIDKLGLASDVHWTGFVDEEAVAAYLNAVDVIALPFRDGASYRRGSLMAAIHHGCAIITTQPVLHIPIFVDGKNMRLVERDNSELLADALCQLVENEPLREALKRGTQSLRQHFDWDVIARETLSFYEHVIGAIR